MRAHDDSLPGELLGARVVGGVVAELADDVLLERSHPHGETVLVSYHRATVDVPDVGRFGIEYGRTVTVQMFDRAHAADVLAYLHATVTALLLAQQGRFALHATVVEICGARVALAGRQAAGKSSTALRLMQRGHLLVCDDVAPLEERDRVWVIPSARPLRIAPAAAAALTLDTSAAPEPGPRSAKLALPHVPPPPARLDHIIVLRPSAVDVVGMKRLNRQEALPVLLRNAYRRPLLEPWSQAVFSWGAMIAREVPVAVLHRPATRWTIDAVTDAIERHIDSATDRTDW